MVVTCITCRVILNFSGSWQYISFAHICMYVCVYVWVLYFMPINSRVGVLVSDCRSLIHAVVVVVVVCARVTDKRTAVRRCCCRRCRRRRCRQLSHLCLKKHCHQRSWMTFVCLRVRFCCDVGVCARVLLWRWFVRPPVRSLSSIGIVVYLTLSPVTLAVYVTLLGIGLLPSRHTAQRPWKERVSGKKKLPELWHHALINRFVSCVLAGLSLWWRAYVYCCWELYQVLQFCGPMVIQVGMVGTVRHIVGYFWCYSLLLTENLFWWEGVFAEYHGVVFCASGRILWILNSCCYDAVEIVNSVYQDIFWG